MSHYPQSLLNLIRNFSKLPGIGEKTAERLAMHIMHAPDGEAGRLAASIADLKGKVRLCSRCFSLSDDELCSICRNPARNAGLLCVVEQQADMAAIEKSGGFKGNYHILHGVLSPMNGIGPGEIKIEELMSRIRHQRIEEVVIATGTNVEGEATASYLVEKIAALAERIAGFNVKITRIASGVPVGGDLKYVDQMTIKKAMERRHDV
ncbi:MAG: recombination protein RecR [Deltaproteobacteria bacterium]|nr:recombination protein RecR [Deltaproteobacteria bacterium]